MPGRVVADASVVVKWIVLEDYSEDALKLRDDFLEGRVEIHAPSLLLLEVASAMRKYCLRGLLDSGVAEKAVSLIASCGLNLHEVDGNLALKSLKLSLEYRMSVYDAAYIALALSLNAATYTADERLLSNRELEKLGVVKHVREYAGFPRPS